MQQNDRSNMSVAMLIWDNMKQCEKQRWKQAANGDFEIIINFLKTIVDEIYN